MVDQYFQIRIKFLDFLFPLRKDIQTYYDPGIQLVVLLHQL